MCLPYATAAESAATTRAQTSSMKGPVRVFILIGQSNMNGRGHVATLRDKLITDHPEAYPAASGSPEPTSTGSPGR